MDDPVVRRSLSPARVSDLEERLPDRIRVRWQVDAIEDDEDLLTPRLREPPQPVDQTPARLLTTARDL